VGYVL